MIVCNANTKPSYAFQTPCTHTPQYSFVSTSYLLGTRMHNRISTRIPLGVSYTSASASQMSVSISVFVHIHCCIFYEWLPCSVHVFHFTIRQRRSQWGIHLVKSVQWERRAPSWGPAGPRSMQNKIWVPEGKAGKQ